MTCATRHSSSPFCSSSPHHISHSNLAPSNNYYSNVHVSKIEPLLNQCNFFLRSLETLSEIRHNEIQHTTHKSAHNVLSLNTHHMGMTGSITDNHIHTHEHEYEYDGQHLHYFLAAVVNRRFKFLDGHGKVKSSDRAKAEI